MADGRITVLVENTAGGAELLGEHGLALWIEVGSKRVLFDTGQGKVICHNADRLGIRLQTADAVVLSHGHYDHTGGLVDALRSASRTSVYAHPAAFGPKFSCHDGHAARDIGLPLLDEQRVREQARLVWVEQATEVGDGLTLTGPIPRTTDFEDTGGPFFTDAECSQPDELVDDQAVFIETAAGTVVVLGCAHAGVINTLGYVRSLTNDRPIHTVVGGMHLLNAGPERMDQTVAELRRLNVQRLLPCHCTGDAAVARLWREFPGRCLPCHTGTIIELR